MPGLLERLRETPVLLADGAWGTYFLQCGLQLSLEPPELWNLRFPDAVRDLALEYAGYADIITTNTFGANRIRLSQYGLERKLRKINLQGVALVREAERSRRILDRPILVAGNMGPARGPGNTAIDDTALFDTFREQAALLAGAGARFILLETMTDLAETRIAVQAVKAACDLEVVCSFAFRETAPGSFEMWSGESVDVALDAAMESGVDMTGANCIPATESLFSLLECMRRSAGNAPLWLKPNAGTPSDAAPEPRPLRTPLERLRGRLVEFWQDLRDREMDDPWDDRYWLAYPHRIHSAPGDRILDALGHGVIGGCCGNGPMDIMSLRMELDRRSGGQ